MPIRTSHVIECSTETPLVVVTMNPGTDWDELCRDVHALPTGSVVVGRSEAALPMRSARALENLALTLAPDGPAPFVVPRPADLPLIEATMRRSPGATATLMRVLRVSGQLAVPEAIVVEAFAYSMLLAGPEHRAWLEARGWRPAPPRRQDSVHLARDGSSLTVTLNRPDRHNSFQAHVRDQLFEALELARFDSTIDTVALRAHGPSFCSGGDLDEFGRTPDVVTAQQVRLERNVGLALHALRATTTVYLHGACIGAGCELPSFADRVVADASSFFELPELAMGLIPGAGGTVGIPRRIGRWRTAYLALSGRRLDAATALAWGLVDELT